MGATTNNESSKQYHHLRTDSSRDHWVVETSMCLLLWMFYVFSVLCLLCLCARLFICALWSPAGKGLTSWLSFVVSSISHWYPGSGVVLDCIDSWSFHPNLLCGHLLGKCWPLGSRLWCLTVSMSLSHWYPGSGVVVVSIPDLCTLTYFDPHLN